MDVLRQAVKLFDLVYVGVLDNIAKHPMFSAEDRADMIRQAVREERIPNVQVEAFSGLLVQFARSVGAGHIIRGLRAVTDCEYEFQLASANRFASPGIDMVFFMASAENSFVSSSVVKELYRNGADISPLVPSEVLKAFASKK